MCPIVGIGASAGGLEALTKFFQAMPAESGIAFVIVVHLDPQHVSILPDLLQKQTRMSVLQAAEGELVEPNHVYVIPPNRNLSIRNGRLHLLEMPSARGAALPIDSCLQSLAKDQGRNAACIILSGTGSDGAAGLRAIKNASGLVLSQDEGSAKYDGMPRSAAATGLVDFVLAPQDMPAQLLQCLFSGSRPGEDHAPPDDEQFLPALQHVCAILRSRTGHDFSHYKTNTILRRIDRRMTIHQIERITDYVRYLDESDRESGILFKEILIGVTDFFRDPPAYRALETDILPKFLANRPDGYHARIWVPGCASGEEAYSLAILFHEAIERMRRRIHLQIFATDIDEAAIAVARAGIYPETALAGMAPERLQRFFTRESDGHYRIGKLVREKLVFAPQNVIKDPPFTKLAMISCRNLLIYLDAELQHKLLSTFHYCLEPGGILFLGTSESIGSDADHFGPLNKKYKIFERRSSRNAERRLPNLFSPPIIDAPPDRFRTGAVRRVEPSIALQIAEAILEQIEAAPCVIVNRKREVLYIHGRTGRFLEPAEGRATLDVVEMAKPGLRTELAAGFHEASGARREIVARDVLIEDEGNNLLLDLTLRPLPGYGALQDLMMVVFEEKPQDAKASEPARPRTPAKKRTAMKKTIAQLEEELRFTREDLQTTIEELETSNEELKSANEELQSTNEELQSTNEELETSKEELQSMNEESVTVNQELQARVDELAKVNDDLVNLLDSTEIATVFLDAELCVRRFTPRLTEIIPLTAADTGRPIRHFATELCDVDLAELGAEVLKDLVVRRLDVAGRSGRFFALRIRPYRTVDNVIDGVVLTFDDISELMKLESLSRLAVVVRDSSDAITLVDSAGRFLAWNQGANDLYGYSETEALTMTFADLVPQGGDQDPKPAEILKRAFAGKPVQGFDHRRLHKNGTVLQVRLKATLIPPQDGEPAFLAMTERAATKPKRRSGR